MANPDKKAIIRSVFEAYLRRDRAVIEDAFATDFIFTSPYDDRIDKAAYFERCWPNSTHIKRNDLERIFVEGDEAFVQYKCETQDGSTFRNTEFFVFAGDKIRSIDVYFGASYKNGAFEKKT